MVKTNKRSLTHPTVLSVEEAGNRAYRIEWCSIKSVNTNLICILGCPVISQRNVMNTVILTKISHHIIMRSEQVFQKTVETPFSENKATKSKT